MNDLENEVRRLLGDIADEARPVPLGHRALAGVRRRRERRTRMLSAAAAVLLVAVAVPRLLGGDDGPPEPIPDLSGRNLVVAYRNAGEERVLNPVTGDYRRTDLAVETVTPDLRFAAGTRLVTDPADSTAVEPRLGVLDTRTGRLAWHPVSDPVYGPMWSPDGEHLLARLGQPGSTKAIVINSARDREVMVTLQVPADRLVVSLCWADTQRLLAVTAPQASAPATGTQELMTFDLSGWLLRTVTIPDSWNVGCLARDGRVPATRLAEQPPTASTVSPEVVVVDLSAGTVSEPVRLPWAGALRPIAWRTADSFVAASQYDLVTVDLTGRTVTEVVDRPPGAVGTDDPASYYTILVSAEAADRYAAEIYGVTF